LEIATPIQRCFNQVVCAYFSCAGTPAIAERAAEWISANDAATGKIQLRGGWKE
jgi:hypothetical protein